MYYSKFDKLNRETKEYNNGVRGRRLGWYDVAFSNSTTSSNQNTKKGRYLGNGQYVEE